MALASLWFLGLGVYVLPRMHLSPRKSRTMLLAFTLLFLAFLGVTFGRPAPLLALRYPLLVDLTTGIIFSLLLYAILHANPARAGYQRAAHFIAAPTYTLYANHLPALVFLLACIGVRRVLLRPIAWSWPDGSSSAGSTATVSFCYSNLERQPYGTGLKQGSSPEDWNAIRT